MSDVCLRSEIKACLSSAEMLASFHQRILQSSKGNLFVIHHLLTKVIVNIKNYPKKYFPKIFKKGTFGYIHNNLSS